MKHCICGYSFNDRHTQCRKCGRRLPSTKRKPTIVCLCGSLRFKEEFQRQELAHLLRGEIALMPCCMWVDIERQHGELSEYKARADERHKQLIDLADEVLVLNVGGYIGNSTRAEIKYATQSGKPVRFLEPQSDSLSRLESAFRIVAEVAKEQSVSGDPLHWPTERARRELWKAVKIQRESKK